MAEKSKCNGGVSGADQSVSGAEPSPGGRVPHPPSTEGVSASGGEGVPDQGTGGTLNGTHTQEQPRPYVNLSLKEEVRPSVRSPDPGVDPRPYVNVVMRESSGDTPTSPPPSGRSKSTSPVKLITQASEPVLQHLHSSDDEPKSKLVNSKLKLLSTEKGATCNKCKELESVVALWELGVSGLTRNYSKILSQLNKAREAAMKLECQEVVREEPEVKDSLGVRHTSVSGRKAVTVRQSMYEGAAGGNPVSQAQIVEHMYPHSDNDSSKFTVGQMKYFQELSSHLAQAMDLCQQLAAASFKNNQRSVAGKRLKHQPTVPSKLNEDSSGSGYRPALQSIAESSGSFKKRTLERTPSAPDSMLRRQDHVTEPTNDVPQPRLEPVAEAIPTPLHSPAPSHSPAPLQAPGDEHTQDVTSSVSSSVGQSVTSSSANQKRYVSHMMKLCSEDDLESDNSTELSGESVSETRGSILSSASTFSDSDVKQIMSKIADLEEDRFKLLATIDDLQVENNTVRLSLSEILGDLQNKDLQLTLALQDLSMATGEIKRAAQMRGRLQEMETERDALNERLSNLEDESAAVKVSLVQLLQEKSATNKTLVLENWRLSQRIKSVKCAPKNGDGDSSRRDGDGDNVSVTSAFSTLTDDATLQEAYMEADDVASFVHKQGFLVKQGGRRKNWKRRLFVLSPEGLAYYKTEEPIQIIPMENIGKVQICRGRTINPPRTISPHLFEVHTAERVFLLSAPSADEMQSWVGMLQTLKNHNRVSRRQEAAAAAANASPVTSPLTSSGRHSDGELASPDATLSPRGTVNETSVGATSPSQGAGPELSSEDGEESGLSVHSNHFGSDDNGFQVVDLPMSFPTGSFVGNDLSDIPQVKPRVRSDST